MISPGLMPVAMAGGVTIGGVGECAPAQACIIEPRPWQPGGLPTWPVAPQPAWAPIPTYLPEQHTHYHLTPAPQPQRLSDEDVERIARRVAELLREPPAGR